MISMWRGVRLVPALFRFVREDVVRSRRAYFAASLGGYALVELLAAVTAAGGSADGFGSRFILVSFVVAAPFCRSWLNEDVRFGYAALWLQKPLSAFDYYLALILALIVWSVAGTLAVGLASMPASMSVITSIDVVRTVLALGWITTTLAVLSFLGSALGARNSGLFAYGVLCAGFALPGFGDAVWLRPAYRALEAVLPPVYSALQAHAALKDGRFLAAAADLRPLLVYILICAGLALALAAQAPKRLVRVE